MGLHLIKNGVKYGIGVKIPTIDVRSFSLVASNWVANSDSTTSTDYPYIYTIPTTLYNASDRPVWDLDGAGALPTATERQSIDMILEAIFSATNIVLYAKDLPTVDLTLRVKGR